MQTKTIKAALIAAALGVALAGNGVFAPSAHAQDNGRHYDRNDRNNQNDNRNNRYNRNNRQDWSDLTGQPSIRAGRESGFFIWRSGNTVHLVTTDTNSGSNRYKGEITIDGGRFNNVTREGSSKNQSDKVERPQPDRITFEFNTQTDRDGLRFDVLNGDRITFRLSRDGRNGDRVYFGANKQRMSGDQITFDLRGNYRDNDNYRDNSRDNNRRGSNRYGQNNGYASGRRP